MKRRDTEFQRKKKQSGERKRLLSIAAVPLVIVLLIGVITLSDRKKEEPKPQETVEAPAERSIEEVPEISEAAETASGEAEAAGAEAEAAEEQETILEADTNPELLSLMKEYFKARETGDAETINRLYGVGQVGVVTLEAEKTRLRSNSKYIRSFDHITTYVRDGLTEDTWLVYSTADIQFHSVKTAAPMIMWCYVTKDEAGNYLIQDPSALSAEVLQYVDIQNRSEEVRRLASGVNTALKEALLSDADLNEVYGVLRDGSPVYEGRQEENTRTVQIIDESAESAVGETCVDDTSGESVVLDDGGSQQ